MSRLRQASTVWVAVGTPIRVDEPYTYTYADGTEVAVPWIVRFGGDDLALHVADTATLTRLRDTLTAALDEADSR